MKDEDKTKGQLISELREMRQQNTELKTRLIESTGELRNVKEQLKLEISEHDRVKKELKEQLHFLQKLCDAIPNPIFYKDVAGLYQGCNSAFEAGLGLTKEEIVGKTVYDLYPIELANKCCEMDSALFCQPGVQIYENSVLDADNTRHDCIFNKATYLNTDGSIAGLVGVVFDISEHRRIEKALRDSESKYRTIFETAGTAMVITEEDTTISLVNTEFEKLSGYSKEEIVECQGWAFASCRGSGSRRGLACRLSEPECSTCSPYGLLC